MNWVLFILATTLTLQAFAKQAGNTKGAVSRQNLSDKNVRLDPLLRRALLRALSELEREAQEKAKAEEIRYTRSEPNNFQTNDKNEIQNTADTNYPSPAPTNFQAASFNDELADVRESTTKRFEEFVETTSPVTLQDAFVYQTPASEQQNTDVSNSEQNSPNPTVNPAEIASNLISDANNDKGKAEANKEAENTKTEQQPNSETDSKAEVKKPENNDNEVDIFKAPLVAAFTLHQDSKGTPHSVIPLFRKEPQDNQRQQLLQQQFQLFQQQQQFLQNQFIPSVTITPLSQSNQFNQPPRFFGPGTVAPNFASSTAFPPLVSNSIIPQSFPSSILPAHNFQPSTTLAPFRSNQGFISTLAPQGTIAPQPFSTTLLPPQDFNVAQSHSFNFSPTPQPNFASQTVAPPQGLQPISIPPVTLPLQNEPRFQSPIIVPSLQINPDPGFLNQDQRNQFLIEQNRQRLLEEQNRQEQNKQKQIEEQNRQRLIEEQNRQRLIEEQNRQRQIEEQNRQRQRQLEEERNRLLLQQNSQLRQQRQEQGVDFQRSVGFSFNQNIQNPTKLQNPFSFHIQPSQSFSSPLNFRDTETRNRVNRQEGFGSTGNLGLVNNQGQRQHFGASQFQSNQVFSNFQNPQEYRTIPEEHYRNLPINRFQQTNGFQQFRHQPNNFIQNNVQDVNKQLQKLLLQSGVATDVSGQEDLNIVSKVLALNHERSDTNVEDTIIRNERRVDDPSEKLVGVGEIKDFEKTTETE